MTEGIADVSAATAGDISDVTFPNPKLIAIATVAKMQAKALGWGTRTRLFKVLDVVWCLMSVPLCPATSGRGLEPRKGWLHAPSS